MNTNGTRIDHSPYNQPPSISVTFFRSGGQALAFAEIGRFPFGLRRLRVDRDDPNCLQWIPVLSGSGSGAGWAGTIDYVRFIRQKD
jgi:hypothetical protein